MSRLPFCFIQTSLLSYLFRIVMFLFFFFSCLYSFLLLSFVSDIMPGDNDDATPDHDKLTITSIDSQSKFESLRTNEFAHFESQIENDASVAATLCQARADGQVDKLQQLHELTLTKDGYISGALALRQLGGLVPTLPQGDSRDMGDKILKNVRKSTMKAQDLFKRQASKVFAGERISKGVHTLSLSVLSEKENKFIQSEFKKGERDKKPFNYRSGGNDRSRSQYRTRSDRDRSRSRNRRYQDRDRGKERDRSSDRDRIRCNYCNYKGHVIKDCFRRMAEEKRGYKN